MNCFDRVIIPGNNGSIFIFLFTLVLFLCNLSNTKNKEVGLRSVKKKEKGEEEKRLGGLFCNTLI